MEIKFLKTHEDAQLPSTHIEDEGTGNSGYDIFAVEDALIPVGGSWVVPTGIKVAYITPGYWFKIEARSGLGFKYDIEPHPGIIDNQYRGDLGTKLFNFGNKAYQVKKGDKIAQLIVYPLIQCNISWADKIEETKRGENGFGSSGK